MATQPGTGGRLVGGRYALRKELGRGGMGVVWLAADQVLHREVALKEVTFAVHLREEERAVLRERTLREARAAASLDHPRVVAVYDVVEDDGRPWLVMERVAARSLQELLEQDGPLPPAAVARIGVDVLDALEVAHAAGIVHRDVKPGNVLVDHEGRASLTDFGIAFTVSDPNLTTQGTVLGSPSYMAPERARGETPSPAVDLWSLGATLYTAVEGHTPFDRGEPMATLLAVVQDPLPPPAAAGPLAPVLEGLLTKDPALRTQAAAARRQLQAVAADPAARTRQPDTDGSTPRPRRLSPSGGDVERFDIADLVALASSTKAVLGTVAREARSTARVLADRRHGTGALYTPTPSDGRRPSRHERRVAAKQRRFRFKRRWVVVPVVVLVLLVLLVLGTLALLLTGTITLS